VHYTLSYSFLVDELTSLARAAGRGDRDALARLVRQTQGDVWRFCAHLVDPAAADDLAQETYLRAEFGARTRDRELAARLLTAPTAGLGQPPPEPGAQTTVDLLLAALDPDRRAAFVLTQLLGCSYAEAAQVCDCPIGTIRSRVARAREDLDAMLREPAERPRSIGSSGVC
jgi:RNA polymerase sigma-70 factor (ECF subfamily)